MKKVLFSAAMFATIAGVMLMTSCKKQQDTIVKKDAAPFEQGVSGSEQKIIDFIDSYSAFKKGAKVEGESVSLEEARWQWETTFNYCYGFTQSHLLNMRADTVSVSVPEADGEGNISYSDLLGTYGAIIDAVRKAYANIDMDAKTLQFVMMDVEDSSRDAMNVRVILNTGSDVVDGVDTVYTGPWYGVPFVYGECYPWGLAGPFSTMDNAAHQLQNKIEIYDANHSYYYVPCPNCYTYIENINSVVNLSGQNDNNLFYIQCETGNELSNYQICWTDLNRYYAYYIQLGHYENMPTNLYNQDWYYRTIVKPYNHKYTGWHNVQVLNCTRHWRHNDEYPITIDPEELTDE